MDLKEMMVKVFSFACMTVKVLPGNEVFFNNFVSLQSFIEFG